MAVGEFSLITLDNIKKFMGATGSTSDGDDLLEDLINRVSTLFESYMNRNILLRSYTEYHNGNGAMVLFPKQPKITTVSGIWDDYDWDYLDDDLIDSDNYRIVDENYIVFKNISLNNYTQNIKIIYTAGYSTVPDDLIQACIEEVSRLYKNRNQIDVLSKTLSDGSVSFVSKGFLPKTTIMLNKYKRVSVI